MLQVADFLSVAGGVSLMVYFWHPQHASAAEHVYDTIFMVSFYTGIILLLGVGVCRVCRLV